MFAFQRAPDSHSNGLPSRQVVPMRPSFAQRSPGQLAPPPLVHDNFVGTVMRGMRMPSCTACTGKQVPVSKVFAHMLDFSVPSKDVHNLVMSGPQAAFWGNVSGIL